MFKSLLHLKTIISTTFQITSPISFHSSFSHRFFTTTSTTKLPKRPRFTTSQNPDPFLVFFRSHGFSLSQVNSILTKSPRLISCNTHELILPKFEFLSSKGASKSEIVLAVTKNPNFLRSSIDDKIIPMYELIRRFFKSDKEALNYFISWPALLQKKKVVEQVFKILCDEGVKHSHIAYLIRMRSCVLRSGELRKAVDEVKELGFDPSKSEFVTALAAKVSVSKTKWNEKVDAFKSWGWSEETIAAAFKRHPRCMLASKDKINAIMSFWVNQLGWNSLEIAMFPAILGYSLEKRIIPRTSVVQCLLTLGLMKNNASLYSPFVMSEKLFLERYVKKFEKESFQLLKLYHGERKF
ncbi:hypothetical protein Lal_00001150 [Lupinus albus]|uniref:Putative transcription regulator mTERF family n=1 Tax=Lupinus albus TaxID=3870 RepID=A0A6A5P107_LUPAL|nr:putative transcription regulator mTERF family [Lupinus albus]KAF1891015.1 hypothetical protein Lal_00001150 [Lupinus albus]